jgi:hypothetical protein
VFGAGNACKTRFLKSSQGSANRQAAVDKYASFTRLG